MGFPLEILTAGGGALVGLTGKLMANAQQYRQETTMMAMRLDQAQMKFIEKARSFKDSKFDFAKRTIALTIIFSVFVLPAIMLHLGFPITMGYTELKPGFSFLSIFTIGGGEATTWKEVSGFAITPLHTHGVMAVLGMYFGFSIGKR